jgi:crotonobetainyl-CoA:carnitine CoA-transferase CaiB-like acyl-CoA transferase
MNGDNGPLAGITVVELGSSFAGPFAARILADMGALVIKVEHPEGGDPSRGWGTARLGDVSPAYQTVNQNKRSVTVDFKDAEDLASLIALIDERADVMLQNLRPGTADQLGLGASETCRRNPRLVYCNIGAFGDYGPFHRLPGYDPLMQAFTGIIDVTGDPNGDPARVGVPMIDFGTGMWAAIGILGALQRRAATGQGGIVDSALMETGMAWQSFNFSLLEATGEAPKRMGLRGPLIIPNAAYDTADGKLIITIGTDRQFRAFCDAIGRPDMGRDQRFANNDGRIANEAALNAEINATFATAPRAEWSRRLDAVNVPNAPVQSLDQAADHEQILAGDQLQPDPSGAFRQVALPLRFDGVRPPMRRSAPALGEGNEEFLPGRNKSAAE